MTQPEKNAPRPETPDAEARRQPSREERSGGVVGRVAQSLILYPRYRLLWISNLFFFAGVWTQTLVLGWLVFEITHSEFSVAIFTAARLLPMMLGPLSGVLSDRLDRPKLLLFASAWAFCAISVITLFIALDRITPWGIALGGFCIGLAQSPSQPARFALVADLVGRRSLSNANALNSIVFSMTQVIGPALGGAMIAAFGAAAALSISALWYLISFLALWPLRRVTNSHEVHKESLATLLRTGFRTIGANRLLLCVLSITFAANIFLWPIFHGFMPVIAKEHLGLSPQGLGWLLACAGAGGLTGSLTIASLGDFRFKGGLFVLGTATWGALWALFALSTSLPLSFVLMGLIGFAASPFGVLQTTLLLMMTDPPMQGRVMGIQELTIGVMPFASLMAGMAGEAIGIIHVALINGTLLAISLVLLGLRVPALLRYSGRVD